MTILNFITNHLGEILTVSALIISELLALCPNCKYNGILQFFSKIRITTVDNKTVITTPTVEIGNVQVKTEDTNTSN